MAPSSWSTVLRWLDSLLVLSWLMMLAISVKTWLLEDVCSRLN